MKKKLLAALLAATMVLGMTACGSGDSENAADKSDTAESEQATEQSKEQTDEEDGTQSAALPETYPEKTVKIGVELYDPTEVETLAMQEYFDALKEAGLNVEFIYSEALDSPESELVFIDDCYNAGCQGILGYYNLAMGETVQRCIDYQMYYWGAAMDYQEVVDQYGDSDYVLDIVSAGTNDYDAGYALGEYFVNAGAKKIAYASGGADLGVTMFVNRKSGFEDAIADSDIEVIDVAGFPGDAFFADQSAALSEDIDGVAASFNGLDFWAQPIATAGKTETVPLATIGSITKEYVGAFEDGSVSLLFSGNGQRFGIGVALIINAVDGNAKALQVDGKIGSYISDMWKIDSADAAKEYYEVTQGDGVYRYEDLMSIIVNVNPDANADTLKALAEGGKDIESIHAMHEANDK